MNIPQSTYKHLNKVWWMLKLTYGLLFVIAGADKFLDLVVHWEKYLNTVISTTAGVESEHFMYFVGIVEMIIGVITLSPWTKVGAYLIAFWFGIIVLDLLSMMSYFDIAVRDTVLAIGALSLACLTSIKNEIEKSS